MNLHLQELLKVTPADKKAAATAASADQSQLQEIKNNGKK